MLATTFLPGLVRRIYSPKIGVPPLQMEESNIVLSFLYSKCIVLLALN